MEEEEEEEEGGEGEKEEVEEEFSGVSGRRICSTLKDRKVSLKRL
jgi:hypothetical protein